MTGAGIPDRIALYTARVAAIERMIGRRAAAPAPLTIFAPLPAAVMEAATRSPDACLVCGLPRKVGRYCYRHSRARYRARDRWPLEVAS